MIFESSISQSLISHSLIKTVLSEAMETRIECNENVHDLSERQREGKQGGRRKGQWGTSEGPSLRRAMQVLSVVYLFANSGQNNEECDEKRTKSDIN